MEKYDNVAEKFSPYVKMQEMLANLTQKNMISILSEILSSNFANKSSELPHLISAIIYTVKVRPNQISVITTFIKKLLDYNNEYYQLGEFRPFLLKIIINTLSLQNPFPENTAITYFLYQLINKEIYSFREFVAHSSLYNSDTTISIKSKKWLFCFFGPELEECNEEFYQCLSKLFEFKDEDPFLQRVFHAHFEELEKLSENEWSVFKNRRNYEFDPFSVASIIEHDQITYLSHMSKGSLFDINQHIESSIIARSSFQQNRPTLIQYSALCGSFKCFRFLLQHHAKIEVPDETGRQLSDFLTMSGHPSITNYLFTLNIDIKWALHLSIQFHYHDLFFRLMQEKSNSVSQRDKNGNYIMQQAVISNNLKIFLYLLQNNYKIDEGYKHGNTALHVAAFHGHITMCKFLIAITDDLNQPNLSGVFFIYSFKFIELLFIMLWLAVPISLFLFSSNTSKFNQILLI